MQSGSLPYWGHVPAWVLSDLEKWGINCLTHPHPSLIPHLQATERPGDCFARVQDKVVSCKYKSVNCFGGNVTFSAEELPISASKPMARSINHETGLITFDEPVPEEEAE